ncbi:MAG: hypothetical protein AAF268_09785 [Cyanobacteria bacterium P01_A01_bin.3]
MSFQSSASKIFALVGLGLVIAPIAHARPLSIQRRQPAPQLQIQREYRLRPQTEQTNNYQPLNSPGSYDYQAFAPSAPTSGPQGIWKHGSCNNVVRVLVSNVGDAVGPGGTVTLTVPEPIDDSDYFNAPTVDATYSLPFNAIAAGDHTWIEFTNVDFPEVFRYELNATVTPDGDSNPSNNSRSVDVFVNHACS